MEKYQSLNPSNSRVFINYKDKKKPVKFEYPNKKSSFKVCFGTFLGLWVLFNLFFIVPNAIAIYLIRGISSGFGTVVSFREILVIGGLLLHFFFTPLVLAKVFSLSPTLLSLMPEINKKLNSRTTYYKEVRKIKSRVFEIPTFGNVFLDFEATGEFSGFLDRLEIKEHDFKIYKRRPFRKDKYINNDEVWFAQFHFSKIPKTGRLKIWFN